MKRDRVILTGKILLTVLAFSMNYTIVGQEAAERNFEKIYSFIPRISAFLCSIDARSLKTLLLLLLFIYLFQIPDDRKLSGRTRIAAEILSLTAAVSLLAGNAIYKYDGLEVMFSGVIQSVKSLVIMGGYYLFFQKLFCLLPSGYEWCLKNGRNCSGARFFQGKYARIILFATLLVVWGGVLFIYYPAIFMGDTEDILYMAFNYPTGLSDTVTFPREGVYLTNHHPVLYTALIRCIMEIVRIFGGGTNVRFLYARLRSVWRVRRFCPMPACIVQDS